MFRPFSFNPASRHPSHLDVDSCSPFSSADISPTSIPSSEYDMPPLDLSCSPAASMAELQRQFSNHHISPNTQTSTPSSYHHNISQDSERAMDTSEQSGCLLDSAILHRPLSYSSHLARRAQRQHTSRLQCTPAHLSKLSFLLDSMVTEEDKCYTTRAESTTTSTTHSSASSDAGDLETAESRESTRSRRSSDSDLLQASPNLRYRRSGEVLRDGPSVIKSVRVRKRVGDRRKRISRSSTSNNGVA